MINIVLLILVYALSMITIGLFITGPLGEEFFNIDFIISMALWPLVLCAFLLYGSCIIAKKTIKAFKKME
jgi:hypothetical protein